MRSKPKTELDRLNQRYRGPLMSFFMRRFANHSDAEDLTQEVFIRLMSNHAEDVDNMDAYIFQIATNLLRDRARKEMVRSSESSVQSLIDSQSVEVFDPSRILLGRESLNKVLNCLYDLPERTRNIFILYRVEGMAQRDIADGYGISLRAVQKHIAKAIEHILVSMPTGEVQA